IMAKDLVSSLFHDVTIEKEVTGDKLVGLTYEPLYTVGPQDESINKVVVGEHVTTEDGTGIASIAPAYGEVDSQVGEREGLPMVQIVARDGTIKSGLNVPGEGLFVKKADRAVLDD